MPSYVVTLIYNDTTGQKLFHKWNFFVLRRRIGHWAGRRAVLATVWACKYGGNYRTNNMAGDSN